MRRTPARLATRASTAVSASQRTAGRSASVVPGTTRAPTARKVRRWHIFCIYCVYRSHIIASERTHAEGVIDVYVKGGAIIINTLDVSSKYESGRRVYI